MVKLTDWDDQETDFAYDHAGRHTGTQRPSGLTTDYLYNPAGYLRRIWHYADSLVNLRARFDYEVDGRGNRTQEYERLLLATPDSDRRSATTPFDHCAVVNRQNRLDKIGV